MGQENNNIFYIMLKHKLKYNYKKRPLEKTNGLKWKD